MKISRLSWCIIFYCIRLPTYLLTPWSRVLLEKLTGSAASQEISCIFGTRRFITVLTSARHLSLSWANSIQSPQPPPTSWRSVLILSSHLCLGLPSGLFPSGFPTRTQYTPLPSPIRITCYHIRLDLLFDFMPQKCVCLHMCAYMSLSPSVWLSFVISVSMAALWRRKPVCAETSWDSWCAQEHDKIRVD